MDGDFKGDFTRDTFDPFKHFSRVLMQQGRVQLDADWNEQADILLYYLRTLATHIIGKHGGPDGDNGFKIDQINLTSPDKFNITNGFYYVDGILVENRGDKNGKLYTYQSQPFYTLTDEESNQTFGNDFPILVYLDVWERHITYLEDGSIREVALGINGPDTATRAEVVWQVKVMNQSDYNKISKNNYESLDDIIKEWENEAQPNLLKRLTENLHDLSELRKYGLLRARTWAGAADSTDACITPPNARYRGNENRLYRVEIHNGGVVGKATFKWSRDNGSVVFPIAPNGIRPTEDNKAIITLENLGRDDQFTLQKDDWVEAIDDDYILRITGQQEITDQLQNIRSLLRVDNIDLTSMEVTLALPDKSNFDISKQLPDERKKSLLRRWDQKGPKKTKTGEEPKLINGVIKIVENADGAKKGGWLLLDEGIYIQFQPDGTYRSGDYWLIPARVITGDVEWPHENDNYTPLPPQGVKHHYAPLAIIQTDGTPIDLRYQIKPIVEPVPPAS